MEHTFVICAYKESLYLEECIISLKNQTVPSEIVLATSTPSVYLQNMCSKHAISYYVRDGESGIAEDWNYALSCAKTRYVTIAHQDDIYEKDYTKRIMDEAGRCKSNIILFTDYSELVNGVKYTNRINLFIKKLLLFPLRLKRNQGIRFWKRQVLRFGNAIGCPTITYNMPAIRAYMKQEGKDELFRSHFRSNLDWETTEWLSRSKGAFVYIPETLMSHRIHDGSETTATIQGQLRRQEDYEMFTKFWSGWVAKLITKAYGESEKSNNV